MKLADLLHAAAELHDGFTVSMMVRHLGSSTSVVRELLEIAIRLDHIEEFGRQRYGRRYRLVTDVRRAQKHSVEHLAVVLGGRAMYYVHSRGVFLTIDEASALAARLKP